MTSPAPVRLSRLLLLWAVGLAAVVYVPTLGTVGLLGRCLLGQEDNPVCDTAVGGYALLLLPVVVLPLALGLGTRAALGHGGRAWLTWTACLAATAALFAAYAYLALAW